MMASSSIHSISKGFKTASHRFRNESKRFLFFGATPRIRPFSVVGGGDAKNCSNSEEDSEKNSFVPGIEELKIAYERESLPVTFSDISRANVAIRSGVKRTICEKSYFLSELLGANIFLKPEFRQFTGSFKERGARNALFHHIRYQGEAFKESGAIAASAGNHALALAYHGQQLGIPVTVVMPTVAPLAKVDKCRRFGARVIIEGAHIGESMAFAKTLVESEGITYINGYDDPPIIAGAGTMGMEIIDDVPCVDAVVVPVGGAGKFTNDLFHLF